MSFLDAVARRHESAISLQRQACSYSRQGDWQEPEGQEREDDAGEEILRGGGWSAGHLGRVETGMLVLILVRRGVKVTGVLLKLESKRGREV